MSTRSVARRPRIRIVGFLAIATLTCLDQSSSHGILRGTDTAVLVATHGRRGDAIGYVHQHANQVEVDGAVQLVEHGVEQTL
jgi:hypothetical protein